MPQGVEHLEKWRKRRVCVSHVRIPLMPQGVEHETRARAET